MALTLATGLGLALVLRVEAEDFVVDLVILFGIVAALRRLRVARAALNGFQRQIIAQKVQPL